MKLLIVGGRCPFDLYRCALRSNQRLPRPARNCQESGPSKRNRSCGAEELRSRPFLRAAGFGDFEIASVQGAHELISAVFAFAGSLQGYAIEITVKVVSRIGIERKTECRVHDVWNHDS